MIPDYNKDPIKVRRDQLDQAFGGGDPRVEDRNMQLVREEILKKGTVVIVCHDSEYSREKVYSCWSYMKKSKLRNYMATRFNTDDDPAVDELYIYILED